MLERETASSQYDNTGSSELQEVITQTKQRVLERYSRRLDKVPATNRTDLKISRKFAAKYADTMERPLWLQNVASVVLRVWESRIQSNVKGVEPTDPLAQFSDSMQILTGPVRVKSPEELQIFHSFLIDTPINRWPGTSADLDEYSNYMAQVFLDEVEAYMELGIEPSIVADWLKSFSGILAVDPIHTHNLMSALPSAYMGLIGANLEKLEVSERLRVVDVFEQLGTFAKSVADGIEERLPMYTTETEHSKMAMLAENAKRLADYLIIHQSHPQVEGGLNIPNNYSAVTPACAMALVDHFSKEDATRISNTEIANRMISVLLERRVGIEQYKAFCRSFRINKDIDYSNISIENVSRVTLKPRDLQQMGMKPSEALNEYKTRQELTKNGLALTAALLKNHPLKDKILDKVSNEIVPEMIMLIRIQELTSGVCGWSLKDYLDLGLSRDIWLEHTQKLNEQINTKPFEMKDVRPGSVIFDISMEAGPLHVQHLELLKSLARITEAELISAGIISRRLDGDVVVGVKINRKNPFKKDEQIPFRVRYQLAKKAIERTGYKIFVYPESDLPLPVIGRTFSHIQQFKELGISITKLVRFAGTDDAEKYDYDDLSNRIFEIPHVWGLQIKDLDSYQTMVEKAHEMFNLFNNGSVMVDILPRGPRLHSAKIREMFARGEMTMPILRTLVPNCIAEDVLEVWGKGNWKKYV